MSRPTKKPKVAKSMWWCETCESGSMNFEGIMKHLESEHEVDIKTLKIQRRVIGNIETPTTSQIQWECLVPVYNLRLICSEIHPKEKDTQ